MAAVAFALGSWLSGYFILVTNAVLADGTFQSHVRGLQEFPETTWTDNIELLYSSFRLMITLGTLFITLMAYACFQNWRRRLASCTRPTSDTWWDCGAMPTGWAG